MSQTREVTPYVPRITLRYRIARWLFLLLARTLTRLDVQGLDKAPAEGPLLMTINHTSIMEAPLVMALIPRQPVTAMAKKEYEGTTTGLIIDVVDPVYVDRGEVDRTALREMLRRLRGGAAIGIAPEGTRSDTGALIKAKEGTAYLALQTDAWILPIAAWDMPAALRDLKRLRRPVIHIHAGEPFKLEQRPDQTRKEAIAEGTERIMHAIARLLPPEYRGVYADAVADEGP